MVIPHLFCMGNGYFRRRSPAESHCLRSGSFLSTEAEKRFNMDCCCLNGDAFRSGAFVENGLTHRRSQPLAVVKSTFDFMKRFSMFATLATARRRLSSVSLGVSTDPWPFDQPRNCASFVTREVMDREESILSVTHDSDDHG